MNLCSMFKIHGFEITLRGGWHVVAAEKHHKWGQKENVNARRRRARKKLGVGTFRITHSVMKIDIHHKLSAILWTGIPRLTFTQICRSMQHCSRGADGQLLPWPDLLLALLEFSLLSHAIQLHDVDMKLNLQRFMSVSVFELRPSSK